MDIKLPDGRVISNVPEGTTKSELMQKIDAYDFLETPITEEETSSNEIESKQDYDNPSEIGSFYRGVEQGATGSFGDEVKSSIGAYYAKLFGGDDTKDLSLGELANMSNKAQNQELERDYEENPASTIAGNLAGGLLTGAKIASTKPGTALANSLRTGGTKARIAKNAAVGATSGAVYGAGGAENTERLSGAGKGAIIGGAVGGAIPAVGSTLKKETIRTSDDIAKMAGDAYKKAEQKGGILTEKFTEKFLDEANSALPQTEAGRILAGDSPVTKIYQRLGNLRGRRLSLSEAQEIDEFLGDAIDGMTEVGKVNKQGKKLLDIQNSLRNLIDNANEGEIVGGKEGFQALKEGRKLWSRSSKLRDIEKIIERAEMTDNPATSIKTGFRNLSLNAKRLRGYTAEEKKLIKEAAESGIVSDTLRTLGSRLMPIVTAGAGGGVGSTLAAQAGSMASRNAATKIQFSKAEKIARAIANKELPVTEINKLPTKEAVKVLDALRLSTPMQAENIKGKILR